MLNESELPLPPGNTSEARAEETPLAYRAVRGGLWVAVGSYFNLGFGFAATLVLTRLLSPEDFGVFGLAWFFASLVDLRPKLGIGQAFAQRQQTTGDLIGTHLTLDVAAGLASLVLAGVAGLVLKLLGYPSEVPWVLLALAAAAVPQSVMATAWVLLDRDLRFRHTSLISSVMFPISYLPAFWLALHGAGYWSLVAQTVTYSLLLLVGMWVVARRQLPHLWRLRWRFDLGTARQLVSFGGLVGLASLGGMLVGQFDNFLVGTFAGLAILGFYDRAYRIAQWPSLLVTSVISRAAFYTYARLQDDAVRLQKTMTMTLWLITALALPMALAIFLSADELVALLYGETWLPSVLFLRFLVVYSVLRPLLDDANSLFVAVGRPGLAVWVAGVEAGTLALVGTIATLHFGAVGTAVTVGIAFTIGLAMTYRYLVRLISLRLTDVFVLPAFASAVTVLGYLLLVRLVDTGAWPVAVSAFAKIAYAVVTYALVVVGVGRRKTLHQARYVWRLARGEQPIGG